MKPETLTLRQLNRATLVRQMLLAREAVPVVEAVERLAGMQAQEAKPPFIGLWSRVAGFRRDDLKDALLARDVVRATMMRGTLHLLSAGDYASFRAVFEPMLSHALKILGDRADGLDTDAVLPVARALLAERPLTFTEIRARLLAEFPDVHERALGFAVRMLLPLVMTPTTADRWGFPPDAAFTPADTWLGGPHDPEGRLEPVVRRYLKSFGPASVADFQTWSGLTGMKPVLAAMRGELQVFRDERGRELFDLPDGLLPDADMPAPPRFLPEFDNLVLAHDDRRRLIADEHRGRIVAKNLRVRATFLWDGRISGTWEIERKRAAATLRIAPFETLPANACDAFADEGNALLRFIEPDATSFDIVWQAATDS